MKLHIPGRRRHRGWDGHAMVVYARSLCGRWQREDAVGWLIVRPAWDGEVLAGGGHGLAPAAALDLAVEGMWRMTGGNPGLLPEFDDCPRCMVIAAGLLRLGLDETVVFPPWSRGEARWQRKAATLPPEPAP